MPGRSGICFISHLRDRNGLNAASSSDGMNFMVRRSKRHQRRVQGRELMKSIISLMAACAIGAASFAAPAFAQDKGSVGIAMPTKSSARWIDDGNNIVKQLEEAGYKTDLQYADDDIPNQLSQIENMVTKGVKVLVIASIDGTTLSDVLKQAASRASRSSLMTVLSATAAMSATTQPSTTSRLAFCRRLRSPTSLA